MKEEYPILREKNQYIEVGASVDQITLAMGLSKDLPEPAIPQVFSTSCFPREFRKEASVYIGRQGLHGNKFAIGVHGDRSEVIAKYEIFTTHKLQHDAEFRKFFISELKGRHLICHCKPLDCHGDVIIKLLQLIALDDPSLRPVNQRRHTPKKV